MKIFHRNENFHQNSIGFTQSLLQMLEKIKS